MLFKTRTLYIFKVPRSCYGVKSERANNQVNEDNLRIKNPTFEVFVSYVISDVKNKIRQKKQMLQPVQLAEFGSKRYLAAFFPRALKKFASGKANPFAASPPRKRTRAQTPASYAATNVIKWLLLSNLHLRQHPYNSHGAPLRNATFFSSRRMVYTFTLILISTTPLNSSCYNTKITSPQRQQLPN